MTESQETQITFGYLSAVESPDHGFFGGYLVISPIGRPLEFHCTAPVLPNRAQRILYGATLASYILGEQIADALLAAGKLAPRLIFTDHADFNLSRQKAGPSLVLVQSSTTPASPSLSDEQNGDNASASIGKAAARWADHPFWGSPIMVQGHALQLPAGADSENDILIELIELLCQRVELLEPFQRIHEAVREAQRIGARNQEPHGHAA